MYAAFRRLIASLCLLLAVQLGYGQSETVRIRILEQHRPVSISAGAEGGSITVYSGPLDTPIGEIAPGDHITIRLANGELAVDLPQGDVHALSLRLAADPDGAVAVEVLDGRDSPETRTYPGLLSLAPDPENAAVLRLINEVDVDAYVAAVLPKEYGFDDLEGSKAMTVVVRTYALHSSGKYGPDYDHVDHVGSQVYQGISDITPIALKAVRATHGQVLTYRGALIEATHFASSGGHTADNEDVWESSPLPYLRGKRDPYDDSPHEHWTSTIPRSRLLAVLSNQYGGTINGFVPGERGADGRIQSVRLNFAEGKRREISSNAFRLLVTRHFGVESLKSTRFAVQRRGNTYHFEGQGYGHGVGLNQWGAHRMAERGHDYRDILHFYYTDIVLTPATPEKMLTTAPPQREARTDTHPPVRTVSDTPARAASDAPASVDEQPAARPPRISGW